MEWVVVLEALNVLLLFSLLFVYVQNYRAMKNTFSLGLIFFVVLLLMQNLLAVYFHLAMVEFYSMEAMGHALVLSGAQTLGLGALVFVTWRD